jgi:hypothetical protein
VLEALGQMADSALFRDDGKQASDCWTRLEYLVKEGVFPSDPSME